MFGRRKKSKTSRSKEIGDVLVSDVPALYLAEPLCIWVDNAEAVLCSEEYAETYSPLTMNLYKRQQLILDFQMSLKQSVPFSQLTGVKDSGNYLLQHSDSWDLLIPYVGFLIKKIRKINDPFRRPVESDHPHVDGDHFGQGTFHPMVRQPIGIMAASGQLQRCSDLVVELDRILKECSSKWTVSRNSDDLGLVERIDPMQQQTVNRVLSSEDNASRFLAEAYEKIFGRTPNYTDGYEDLIKAVETLSHPLVSPKSTRASLSTDANIMRDQNDWHYVIEPDQERDKVSGGMLRPLMHALMNNDHARHGDNGPIQQNTEEEAKGGFFVAVLLVEAFRDGYISKG